MQAAGMDEALVDALYGTAVQEGNWRPALRRFCVLLDSCEAALSTIDGNAEVRDFETTGRVLDQGSAGNYESYYGRLDPKRPFLSSGGPGFLFNDARHFDDGFVARDTFYQEFSRPLGTRHTLDLFLHDRQGHSTYFAAMRTSGQGAYDTAAEAVFRQAGTHFVRALALKEKLDVARSAAGALDQLRFGTVVLDSAGRVMLANRTAAESISPKSPLRLSRAEILAYSPTNSRRLGSLIAAALSGRGGSTELLADGEPQRNWTVWCVPLRESAQLPDAPGGKVLLVFRDGSTSVPDRRMVARSYGLSDAEARIAVALAQGRTLDDISKCHGVKRSTVRSQLLAVLEKMGVHRQADVARIVATNAENPLR